MQIQKERLRLSKLYGHLYKRVGGLDWGKCAYCGGSVQCWDHCPPLSIIDGIDIKKYKSKGGKFRLYPACLKCNALLNSYSSTSFYDRLEYLLIKYKKRLEKIPYWSKTELDEMGYNMRLFINQRVSAYEILADKVDIISGKLLDDNYIDLV